jgi:hypothetical protein
MYMPEPGTWQELLRQLITNPQERARLAAAIHVRPVTLQRWCEGLTKPHAENIRQLVKNLPKETYPLFMRLLMADFPELLWEDMSQEPSVQGIPTEFYARALSNLALTPRSIYRHAMQDLILRQALGQLDPDRQGLAITLAICVPPRFGCKVRSLCEVEGMATPPWPRNLGERAMFLGAESLVGCAIVRGYACVVNSREEKTLFPVQWTEHEKSAAAFPIFLHARIVGGLIVSSAHEDFFTSTRVTLLKDYAHLAACIFNPEESFALNEIELGIMPPYTIQRPYLTEYHHRVSQALIEANIRGKPLAMQQARLLVWQDLEATLLQILP